MIGLHFTLPRQKSKIKKTKGGNRVLFVGEDGTGKTTLMYRLKGGSQNSFYVPTIGFNVETIGYPNHRYEVWDIGGQKLLRQQWTAYYPRTDVLLFFFNAASYVM